MRENENLETLLSIAKEDEEADAQFIRELFLAEIYFLGEVMGEEDEEDPDAQISVVEWQTASGYHFVPAFTSLRLLEQSVSQDQPYIKVKAGDFLEAVHGNVVAINPGTALERVISVEEAYVLLSIYRKPPIAREKLETVKAAKSSKAKSTAKQSPVKKAKKTAKSKSPSGATKSVKKKAS